MKPHATQPSHGNAPSARQLERFSTLDRIGRYITIGRFFLALAAASAFWPTSDTGALVLFFCLFFVPVPTAFDVTLRSGRLVRKATARSFFTLPHLRRILEVRYESCTDNYRSMEFLREEVEICTAVMDECEELGIYSAEIVAVMPTAVNDFNMEQTTTKIFEKVNGRWVDASNTA